MDWGTHAAAPSANDWDIKGRWGPIVSAQANAVDLPDEGGVWDIYDVTDPHKPEKKTGLVGAIGMRYALYYVANYGLGGHTYRILSRRDVANGERQARSFLVKL